MFVDYHIYLDESYYNVNQLTKLLDNFNISKAIISPPCTKVTEPEKSDLMYFIQRKLLMNTIGFNFSKTISKSFYNEKNELRLFWKLFSGNKNLHKVMSPDNGLVYNLILNKEKFLMWYWINPLLRDLAKDEYLLNKYSDKIFGIKFHQYWHNFNLKEIYKYESIIKKKKLKLYLLLNYQDEVHILNLVKKFNHTKIIFGYGGFPLFNRIWDLINANDNCFIDLTSNHIDIPIIKKIINKIKIEKIVFGSDCPYNFKNINGEFDYNLLFQRLDFLKMNEKQKILNNIIE